jgi:ATP-binding protein involved in chromosome partitioning
VAVGSGKGGVGKSTVAVNLALALRQAGYRTAIVDADVLGPSVPVMLGVPRDAKLMQEGDRIIPVEAHGVKLVSMGLLTGDDKPAILRGPMLLKYLQMFIRDVAWGELDYLIMDLPPGTGDVQLTLAQGTPLSGAIIVTTPQDVSLNIARRGLRMFETVKVPILGLVENMSGFLCPHCGERTDVFRHGGGEHMAHEVNVPFLGAIPLDVQIVLAGDTGRPVVVGAPASEAALAYAAIASRVQQTLDAAGGPLLEPFAWRWDTEVGAPLWRREAVSTKGSPTRPAGFRRTNPRTLSILWEDGKAQEFDVRELRLACECAACRDEVTGRQTLDPKSVRVDVAPRLVASVGTYGITFQWNDGHTTGIYTFELLRKMGDRSRVAHDV